MEQILAVASRPDFSHFSVDRFCGRWLVAYARAAGSPTGVHAIPGFSVKLTDELWSEMRAAGVYAGEHGERLSL